MIVAFGDPLEKKTYQVKLEQLRQHGDTAKAFFVKFDLYHCLAGYQEEHDQYLTSLLEKAIQQLLVDKLFAAEALPETYEKWKEKLIRLDAIERHWNESKKFEASTF